MAWTDPATLAVTVGDLPRASWANALLGNLAFLYDPPTITTRVTTDQAVASGSDHVIQWDEAAWDTSDDGMWDAGTPGSIVIDRPGVYLVVCSVLWETVADDASSRAIYVERDGTQRLGGDRRGAVSAPEGQVTVITSLDEGSYLEFIARQISGSTIDMLSLRTRCTVTWLRPQPPA